MARRASSCARWTAVTEWLCCRACHRRSDRIVIFVVVLAGIVVVVVGLLVVIGGRWFGGRGVDEAVRSQMRLVVQRPSGRRWRIPARAMEVMNSVIVRSATSRRVRMVPSQNRGTSSPRSARLRRRCSPKTSQAAPGSRERAAPGSTSPSSETPCAPLKKLGYCTQWTSLGALGR